MYICIDYRNRLQYSTVLSVVTKSVSRYRYRHSNLDTVIVVDTGTGASEARHGRRQPLIVRAEAPARRTSRRHLTLQAPRAAPNHTPQTGLHSSQHDSCLHAVQRALGLARLRRRIVFRAQRTALSRPPRARACEERTAGGAEPEGRAEHAAPRLDVRGSSQRHLVTSRRSLRA